MKKKEHHREMTCKGAMKPKGMKKEEHKKEHEKKHKKEHKKERKK